MKKKQIVLLFMLLLVQSIWAQQVSQSEALNRARQFFSVSKQAKIKRAAMATFELAYVGKQGNKTHYYVFNNPSLGDQGGFVIVGGDESARTILGYSTSGTFDYDKLPENVRWWLSEYDQQIARGIRQGVTSATRKVDHSGWTTIPDLVTTKWDQGVPFNNALPVLTPDYTGNSGLATGCVATAMAQVMAYHKYPTQGIGSRSYKQKWNPDNSMIYHDYDDGWGYQAVMESYGIPDDIKNKEVTLSADFGNTTYDWDNMPDWYFDGVYLDSKPLYNDAQAEAVSTLMYHCGVAVGMAYDLIDSGGSGASSYEVPVALINYFGYDKSAYSLERYRYSDEAWEQKIYDELKANRPVFYCGSSDHGGHAFVCHGYDADKDFFAFNWGWGGYCDGYYPLTGAYALQPNGSGIGGAGDNGAYTDDQGAMFNIMPDQGGDYHLTVDCYQTPNQTPYTLSTSWDVDEESNVVLDAVTNYTLDRSVSDDVDLYMICNPMNSSLGDMSFQVGVKLTGQHTGAVYYQRCQYELEPLPPYYFFINLDTQFNTSILEKNDTYTVEPVYRLNDDEDWEVMYYAPSMQKPTVTVQYGPTGDVNGDGTVNISDVTLLVNIILGNATDPYGNADVNGDGTVNISDVTLLVNIILGNA